MEFSRVVEVRKNILDKKFEIFASNDDLKGLANRFGIFDIESLTLKYTISDKANIAGAYLLSIEITSSLTKSVVAGLEENMEIEENFDIILLNEKAAKENEKRFKNSDVEILSENNSVDIGEIASQYLSLFVFM